MEKIMNGWVPVIFSFLLIPLCVIFNKLFFHIGWAELLQVLFWYLLILGTSIISFPIFNHVFKDIIFDKGWFLSRTITPLVFAYLIWGLGHIPGLRSNITFVWVLISLLSLVSFRFYTKFKIDFPLKNPKIYKLEIFCVYLFILLLVIKSFHSEIFSGEKFQDFSILNSLLRSESFPLMDPWSFDQDLKYYYLGYIIPFVFTKMTALKPAIAYSVSVTTFFYYFFINVLSLFMLFTNKVRTLIFVGLSILFANSFYVIHSTIEKGWKLNFGTFWEYSRVFANELFSEAPFWSFYFGDLHPHFMAWPYTVSLLMLAYVLLNDSSKDRPVNWGAYVLLAFNYGSFIFLNTWDSIAYGVTAVIIFVLMYPSLKKRFWSSFFRSSTAIILGVIIFLPVFFLLNTGVKIKYGFFVGALNNLYHFFKFNGHWMTFIPVLLLVLLGRAKINDFVNWKRKHILEYLVLVVTSLSPLLLCLKLPISLPIYSALTLLVINYLIFFQTSSLSTKSIFGLSLVASAVVLMLFQESICLFQRYNMLFKIQIAIWTLLGVGFFILFVTIQWSKWVNRVLYIAISFTCLGSIFIFWSLKDYTSHLTTKENKIISLDGAEFMNSADLFADDKKIIDWIWNNVSGRPRIIESYKDLFSHYSRISSHTGLPTLLGWHAHLVNRGVSSEEIYRRRDLLDFIYLHEDVRNIHSKLKDHLKVKYLVWGKTEEQFYKSGEPVNKFINNPQLFKIVFRSNDSYLFEIL